MQAKIDSCGFMRIVDALEEDTSNPNHLPIIPNNGDNKKKLEMDKYRGILKGEEDLTREDSK